MKDSNDKQTLDLLDKPRRGRPVTGKAKTQAQIQREYRQRKKINLDLLPSLEQALAGFELWYLPKGCRNWRKFSGHDSLSWEAVNAMYRGAIACNVIDIDAPEIGASYEIRCTLERVPFLKRIDHFED